MNAMSVFYEKQAETIIKALHKRGMDGHYCPDCKSAVEKALSMIPEDVYKRQTSYRAPTPPEMPHSSASPHRRLPC